MARAAAEAAESASARAGARRGGDRTAVEVQERREVERKGLRPHQEPRRTEAPFTEAARIEPEFEEGTSQPTVKATRDTVNEVARVSVDDGERATDPPSAKEEARARRAVAREERQAKRAARVVAAIEKWEARERKALGRAAARRRVKGIYRT